MARVTPPDGNEAAQLAGRGVYRQPYLVRGKWEYVAISSRGEQVAVRWVRVGLDPAEAERDLWDELNEADPIAVHLTPPFLRLVD